MGRSLGLCQGAALFGLFGEAGSSKPLQPIRGVRALSDQNKGADHAEDASDQTHEDLVRQVWGAECVRVLTPHGRQHRETDAQGNDSEYSLKYGHGKSWLGGDRSGDGSHSDRPAS